MKMISLRKLFSNSFPDHEGRPGQVGGSVPEGDGGKSSSKKPANRLGWSPPAKFEKYNLPLRRPDYSPISNTPDKHSARRGLSVGMQARGNYSPVSGFGEGEAKTVTGEIIGFVGNRKNHPGGSTGDVVIFDEKSRNVYFVASRNVFGSKKKK